MPTALPVLSDPIDPKQITCSTDRFRCTRMSAILTAGDCKNYDFTFEGMVNAGFRGSAGQTTAFRFDRIIKEIVAGTVPVLKRQGHEPRPEDTSEWAEKRRLVDRILAGNVEEKGQLTVLLDESERSFDLPTQIGIWRLLRAFSSRVQFIVASHSFYALDLPEANYLELTEGYLGTSLQCLAMLAGWDQERPGVEDFEARLRETQAEGKAVTKKVRR